MLQLVAVNRAFNIRGFFSAIRFDWNDSFVFNGESHDFWEVVFVESGEVEVTEDENVYTLGESSLIFHAPMEFHRIKSAGGSSPKGFILSFDAEGDLPQSLRGGVFALDPYQSKQYRDVCDKLHKFFHGDRSPLAGQEAAALLTAFFIDLDQRGTTNESSMTQSAAEYRALVSFMTENVFENLTLDDIAKHNNISVSYVKLLFKTYAGISPKSYFNQLRIRRATELLLSEFSVSEIAEIMNFSSPNYFSAFYRKNTGLSPSDVKRKYRP